MTFEWCWHSENQSENRVIQRYLEYEWEFEVHILWFQSTHEHYKTPKYQLHRTTGVQDRALECSDHQVAFLKSVAVVQCTVHVY